jgi:hypothetical protein
MRYEKIQAIALEVINVLIDGENLSFDSELRDKYKILTRMISEIVKKEFASFETRSKCTLERIDNGLRIIESMNKSSEIEKIKFKLDAIDQRFEDIKNTIDCLSRIMGSGQFKKIDG